MITAVLLAIVSPMAASPVPLSPVPASAALAPDTVAHLKGNLAVPASTARHSAHSVNTACHPDPMKGRACRHHVAQKESKRAERHAELARAQDARDAVRQD